MLRRPRLATFAVSGAASGAALGAASGDPAPALTDAGADVASDDAIGSDGEDDAASEKPGQPHQPGGTGGALTFLPRSAHADAQLVEGLRQGDPASYRHLYAAYAPRLLRTLERIFRDPILAEDAVQATFLIVYRKIGQFNSASSLLTWMTRIAIHEAQKLARKGRAPRAQEVEVPLAPAPSPEQQSADRQLQVHLEALIAALPLEKRSALLLFEVDGFSVPQIAEITGEPKGTILARLSRTRAELRESLQRWASRTPNGRSQP